MIGPYSLPASAALALATAGTIALFLVAVLPSQTLLPLASWIQLGLRSLRAADPRGTRTQGMVLAAMALGCYTAVALKLIGNNEAPRDDQLRYLQLSGEIRRAGGVIGLCQGLWAGTYTEANQHPLYPVMLSLLPGSDHEPVGPLAPSVSGAAELRRQFRWAKGLSFSLGLLLLVIISAMTTVRYGWLAGGGAAALLASNTTVGQSSSLVACEIVLTLCVLLAWFTASSRIMARPTRSGLVGVWLALAYLTKASALLLLVGFVIWSLAVPSMRRWGWLAVLSFTIVASPLLVRNVRLFANPVYNFNTRFLFADRFDPDRDFRGTWAELKSYIQDHSVGSVARRALGGLGWEGYILLRTLAPVSFANSRALVGLVIGLMALLGAWAIRGEKDPGQEPAGREGEQVGAGEHEPVVWLLAVWCGFFYVFFAWYVPIAPGDRFWAPLVPPLLILAARGATSLISASTARSELVGRRLIWAAALWCVAATALGYLPGRM